MEKCLRGLFDALFSAFGPQGWWPITPRGQAKPVYHISNSTRTLTFREQTEIMVGAILTQNTSWTNVEKALAELHASGLVDFAKLVKASRSSLAKKIRSAGYYNQKSARLRSFSAYMVKNYGPSLQALQQKDLLSLRQELLSLKGVGPETADSMILYAFSKPIFVVDAYTRRIFGRVGIAKKDATYADIQDLVHTHVPQDKDGSTLFYKEFHALLVELAKRHCRTKPVCAGCPARPVCQMNLLHSSI